MNKYPMLTLALYGVLGAIALLNAALTAVFGANYLHSAFGDSGTIPAVMGGVYALLILDIAGYTYLAVFASGAETRIQRGLTLTIGIVCLMGSIGVTVVQLSNTAFGLTAFGGYQALIEFVALIMMIALTAIHAAMFAAYRLLSASGQVKQKSIDIKTNVTAQALTELETRLEIDAGKLADQMADHMRGEVLRELGFDRELRPVIPAVNPTQSALNRDVSDAR